MRTEPSSWPHPAGAPDDSTIQVIPVATDDGCTGRLTDYATLDTPEVEIWCGGLQPKHSQHAVVWRQGHLMHFGFAQGPSEWTAFGRRLFLDAVRYIAEFTEDRPIAASPTRFNRRDAVTPRIEWAHAALRQRYAPEISFRRWFDPGLRAELATSTRDELETWLRDHERWLLPDPEHPHQLQVAEWLRPLGVSAGAPEFLSIAPDLAATELGVSRLRRLFPTAPPMTTRAEWQTFLRKHGNALFFTESGHVWLVDPLAVARRVPSCQLRGPDRRDPTES